MLNNTATIFSNLDVMRFLCFIWITLLKNLLQNNHRATQTDLESLSILYKRKHCQNLSSSRSHIRVLFFLYFFAGIYFAHMYLMFYFLKLIFFRNFTSYFLCIYLILFSGNVTSWVQGCRDYSIGE